MKTLGIDLGEKRIGLAVSDDVGMLAFPYRVIVMPRGADPLVSVADACLEAGCTRVVVGLPLNMDGTAGPMAAHAREFAGKLAERIGLPVHLWDERLSTALIERHLIGADMRRDRRREVRDKLAAQVILQGYLDAQATEPGSDHEW